MKNIFSLDIFHFHQMPVERLFIHTSGQESTINLNECLQKNREIFSHFFSSWKTKLVMLWVVSVKNIQVCVVTKISDLILTKGNEHVLFDINKRLQTCLVWYLQKVTSMSGLISTKGYKHVWFDIYKRLQTCLVWYLQKVTNMSGLISTKGYKHVWFDTNKRGYKHVWFDIYKRLQTCLVWYLQKVKTCLVWYLQRVKTCLVWYLQKVKTCLVWYLQKVTKMSGLILTKGYKHVCRFLMQAMLPEGFPFHQFDINKRFASMSCLIFNADLYKIDNLSRVCNSNSINMNTVFKRFNHTRNG